MAAKPQAAFDRLAAANGDPYNATSNPGGLADGGHRQNFVSDLKAVVDVGNYAAASAAELAGGASAAAGSAQNAKNSETAAAQSAQNAAQFDPALFVRKAGNVAEYNERFVMLFGPGSDLSRPQLDAAALEVRAAATGSPPTAIGAAGILFHRPNFFSGYFGVDMQNRWAFGSGGVLSPIWHDALAAKSFGPAGFRKTPDKKIEQWGICPIGTANGVDYTGSVNFPTAFPNACHRVFACGLTNADSGDARLLGTPVVAGSSKTGCTISLRNNVQAAGIGGVAVIFLAFGE